MIAASAGRIGDLVGRKRAFLVTLLIMGGPLVVKTAAAVPNRIGAGASFHGGGLVPDRPDSPHTLAPKIKGASTLASRRAPSLLMDAPNIRRDEDLKSFDLLLVTHRSVGTPSVRV